MSNFIQVTPFMDVEDLERALAFRSRRGWAVRRTQAEARHSA